MSMATAGVDVLGLVRGARALVFDFDGTLVDSEPIKAQAFKACFAEFPDRLPEIMAYCRGEPHTPRAEKFRHVYEEILGLEYTASVESDLHARFEAASTRQIIEAPEVPGTTQLLEAVGRTQLTAVLSSTPHAVLLRILSGRGWRDYFRLIRGAPVDKAEWLTALRTERGFGAADVVFFGDKPEDAVAARAAGCSFVAVGAERATPGAGHSILNFVGLLTR